MVMNIKKQHGLGLATAIFVITVMAFLAVVINQLVQNNAETTEEEIQLIRSFYAAESGVQLGLNALFPPPASGVPSSCPASTSFMAPFTVNGLNTCTVVLECSGDTKSVGGVNYYTLTSTGTCGDVSRTIQVRAQ
ncbi:hypothetical protein OAP18_01745 [Gammaproteobacteria bacterium]|nr:hypothetical protein [Gammaproteobacteria bacterium]